MKNEKIPLVVIFGRTNVGKSTFFNTLMEKKKALVSDQEGTTRDANLGIMEWNGKKINFVDTGGIMDIKNLSAGKKFKSTDIDTKVQLQARDYLVRADLILLLVDAKSGLLPQDKQMASVLKKKFSDKKIILAANKCDGAKDRQKIAEFFKLNIGEPIAISAATGSGTGDLLDIILSELGMVGGKDKIAANKKLLKAARKEFGLENTAHKIRKKISEEENNEESDSETSVDEISTPSAIAKQEENTNVCILGQPNVGKSSLLNAILGYERVIVSPLPHTTREPQDTDIIYKGNKIKLIDTAGISRQAHKTRGLIKSGAAKSLTALSRAHIALLVIDVNAGLTHQDTKIVEEIISRKKSIVIIANKWDLIEEKNPKKYTADILNKVPFISWVPIHFASALTGSKIDKIMDLILSLKDSRHQKIKDSALNTELMKYIKIHQPPLNPNHKRPYISQLIQTYTNPPEFTITVRANDKIPSTYLRFIENRLRAKFNFLGTPLKIKVNKKRRVHGKAE